MNRFFTILLLSILAVLGTACNKGISIADEKHLPQEEKLNDAEFLDMISRSCFEYFWKEAGQKTGLVKDNSRWKPCSIAATGFGLSAMVIGAEHSYREREAIEDRVRLILKTMENSPRKDGMFFHFLDIETGLPSEEGYETVTSTIDSAIFLFGAISAGEYFGGDIKEQVDRLVAEVNWKSYSAPERKHINMGWKAKEIGDCLGEGEYLTCYWDNPTAETLLVDILAISAPNPEFRVTPDYFYRWNRPKGRYIPKNKDLQPGPEFVYNWSGAMFAYQFANCFLDLKYLGRDNPGKFGCDVVAVNWFENSVAASKTARLFSIDNKDKSKTFGEDSWGMTACAAEGKYYVAGFPPRIEPGDPAPEGTVAPYGAGGCIMFTPKKSMAALRYYYSLKSPDGKRMLWKDISAGGYGFYDSFNLDTGFVAHEYLGIDQGPLMLGIESYRSGLVQKQIMKNIHIQSGLERIGFAAYAKSGGK